MAFSYAPASSLRGAPGARLRRARGQAPRRSNPDFLLALGLRRFVRNGVPARSASLASNALKHRAIADHLQRRRAIRAAGEGELAAGGPAAAFEDARQRQLLRRLAGALADQRGQTVEQGNRERAP